MKQSKTTLKELTAAYRAVLRRGILCNAIALGLIAVVPARAETITYSDYNGSQGALAIIDGSEHIGGEALVFESNTSTSHGAGLYYKVTDDGLSSSVILDAASITFNNNASNSNTSSGGALFNSGGDVSILGDTNVFTNNYISGVDGTKPFKRGGGAVANQSYETESNTEPKVSLDATMVIGKLDGTSENTFSNNTSSMNGGAVMNRALDTDGNATLTINGTTTFDSNTAAMNGGAIYNVQRDGKTATVNLNNGEYTFTNNVANDKGGAVYNEGTMTLANATFGGVDNSGDTPVSLGNTAIEGGAIYNKGTLTFSNATTFANNAASNTGNAFGGAIANFYGDLTFNGVATFNNNSVTSTEGAGQGGALHNLSATTTFNDGATFSGNTASSNGAAIYNGLNYQRAGIVNINGDSLFENNTAAGGKGIVFNVANADVDNTIAFANGDATFRGNTGIALWNQDLVTFTNMGDVLFENNTNTAESGSNAAISNGGTLTVNATNFTVQNNTSSKGAIGNTSPGSVLTVNASDSILFDNNTGGAIYKENDDLTLTAGNSITFSGNSGGVAGPALNNNGNHSKTTLNADEIEFSGNTSTNSYGGAIFNSGDYIKILGALNTFAGNRAESMTDTVKYGGGAISNRGNAASNGATTIEIGLANGSSANAFTNNYSGAHGGAIHARAEGANDKGGVTILGATEFSANKAVLNGGAISNSPVSGLSTVTLTGSGTFEDNLAGGLGGAIYNKGVTSINATTGDFTFSGNKSGVSFDAQGVADAGTGEANDIYNIGTLTLNAAEGHSISLAGGITGASDSIATNIVNIAGLGNVSVTNALTYQTVNNSGNLSLNADLTGTTITNAEGATITLARDIAFEGGENTLDGYNGTLAKDITVADGAVLTINNATFTSGDGDLINEQGGVLRINDSLVNVDVTNHGTLISDPTTYNGTVTNTNIASFDADTFSGTAELANSGTASLSNGVTFESGATITGAGITNLAGGYTHFNNTASDNTINVVSGANFDGTVIGGTINTQNGMIDTIAGSIQNANVALDVNTTSLTTDTFASVTGSTIKSLNVSGAYGNAETATIAMGTGLSLADDAVINGGYYTVVEDDGEGNLVFSDKLVNTSGLYAKLGTWTDGEYIKSNVDMDNAADTNHLTVGGALQALDTAVQGKVSASDIYTATITNEAVENSNSKVVSVTSFQNSIANLKNSANTWAGVQGFTNGITIGSGYGITGDGAATVSSLTMGGQTVSGIDTEVAQNSNNLITSGAVYSAVTTAVGHASTNEDPASGVYVAIEANTAAITSNTEAIETLTGTGSNSVSGQIASNAQNATYTAGGHAAGTIGAALDTLTSDVSTLNTTVSDLSSTVSGLTGTGSGSISGQIASNAQNATYTAGGHAAGTVGAAIDQHTSDITAINGKIGDMSDFGDNNYATDTASVSANLAALDGQLKTTSDKVDTLINGDEDTAGSVRNIAKSYFDLMAQDSALTLSEANAYTDKRIEKLDQDLSAGIASAVALSSVAVSDVRRGELSVGAGYGYFNGQSAGAFGAAMGISNRWSVNAGAGVSGYDVSFRAGTNYKFKVF